MTSPVSAPTEREIQRWCIDLLRRAGIEVVVFADGSSGIVNVPAKYCAVMDCMSVAMIYLARGEGLPELAEQPARKYKRMARRRP